VLGILRVSQKNSGWKDSNVSTAKMAGWIKKIKGGVIDNVEMS